MSRSSRTADGTPSTRTHRMARRRAPAALAGHALHAAATAGLHGFLTRRRLALPDAGAVRASRAQLERDIPDAHCPLFRRAS